MTNKFYIVGSVVMLLLIQGFSLPAFNKSFSIEDVYEDRIIQEAYQVEVCSEQRVPTEADVFVGAVWGAIFGAVVGDVIDDENGKVPGAIVGGVIGANEAEKNGEIKTVCKLETRYTESSSSVYAYSIISFGYDNKQYEINFIK